jgi:hypothetical protein
MSGQCMVQSVPGEAKRRSRQWTRGSGIGSEKECGFNRANGAGPIKQLEQSEALKGVLPPPANELPADPVTGVRTRFPNGNGNVVSAEANAECQTRQAAADDRDAG